ncbi:hypothetical protein BIFLH23_01570 [Bifidobacterium longum subsp. infantis]|uniref:Uncharacterized protein n=1 Tax=Bifidobacterium longum subsp. infantis TaxID=1682 RepID=A0A8U0LGN0_BIFLI|nr:hypothetical protein [Bifidobacterium longum]VWQ36680.1 hypothetical protein BIFLH23_01570 [Bifidobacterium longum subsp. infantis]
MAKLAPLISDDFDASELRPDQLKTLLAQTDALIAGFTEIGKRLRAQIEDDMDVNNRSDSININGLHVADITLRMGGKGKSKCVDQQAYVDWLLANGKEDMTETVTVPVKAALEASYIDNLVSLEFADADTGEVTKPVGEYPAGCELGKGSAGGISVSYVKDVYQELLATLKPSNMMGLLTSGHVEEEPEAGEPEW